MDGWDISQTTTTTRAPLAVLILHKVTIILPSVTIKLSSVTIILPGVTIILFGVTIILLGAAVFNSVSEQARCCVSCTIASIV